ncbi:MAG: M48 family metallopeptidase, partial [Bacteroidales bacterium]
MATRHRLVRAWLMLIAALALLFVPLVAGAQTPVTAPKNKYTPEQDVQLGDKAAEQVRQEFPVVRDQAAQTYVQRIGQRLVNAIPTQFRHPQFHYTFQVVNAKDLNAFALPGGPMFVDRGMIQAVRNEGELAGVMAHELSHVALRHGTAQATKATPYEIGTVAGQILGAIVGGTAGQVIATGSQFGIGTAFLRFSREYEQQADILGSHIMAAAGYDPRDMAAVFKMLEQQGGPGGPEFLSDHPNPGNRFAYIEKEAQQLQVNNAVPPTGELTTVQADLRRLPPAPTMAQLEQAAKNGNPQGNSGAVGTGGSGGSAG